jgi:hypothetical protein
MHNFSDLTGNKFEVTLLAVRVIFEGVNNNSSSSTIMFDVAGNKFEVMLFVVSIHDNLAKTIKRGIKNKSIYNKLVVSYRYLNFQTVQWAKTRSLLVCLRIASL